MKDRVEIPGRGLQKRWYAKVLCNWREEIIAKDSSGTYYIGDRERNERYVQRVIDR